MNQNNRICMFQGHQDYQVTHICTLNECDHTTRWCCVECLRKGVHNHKRQDHSHVMNRKDLHTKVMNQYEIVRRDIDIYKQQKSMQLPIFLKILKELQRIVINYSKQYQDIEIYMQNIRSNFEQCLSNIQENNFQQLDDGKINQILNINQIKFEQQNSLEQLKQPLDSIKQQLYQIDIIIKEYQENQKKKNNNSNQYNDIKNRKYIIQKIDKTNDRYDGSSISKNEQYLAYGAYNDKLLKIYDIKLKKITKKIKLDYCLNVCQFTQDSSQLYVGLYGGYAHGYDVYDDFKKIFNQQIHSSIIDNIITIQNEYLITCSGDNSIIKTDIKSKQQIFKLTGHTSYIIAIDYNDKDEIIVSGSYDESIKLWNCGNQSIIINKEQSHNTNIRQIKLINNNLNLLSLDIFGNLYKWKIDLINKDLIKLQQFSDKNEIFNFYQVNQDQNLLLICNNYAKILNQQGETINTIEHGGKRFLYASYDCRQLDNLKYIQIRAEKKIILAIAQD